MFNQSDYEYMSRAIMLARKGLYSTDPNPKVGCVIVKNNQLVSQGWHQKAGGPHAEIHALHEANENLTGAHVYVTLEPCSHHGRTPPCADSLIQAGVTRVIIACRDPNPLVNGAGIQRLEQAGITVETGLLESEARELNKGFFTLHEKKRPWIRLKTAVSLDGRTAMASGESQWITGTAARQDGHRFRAKSSAVLTGINTILKDDPRLTVRSENCPRQPIRIILDSTLRTPTDAKIFDETGDILILTGEKADHPKSIQLHEKGATVIQIKKDAGRINLSSMLDVLVSMKINELHVEAGGILSGEFVAKGLVDEIVIYMAPLLLGKQTEGMFDIPGINELTQKVNLDFTDMRMVGSDLRLIMRTQH